MDVVTKFAHHSDVEDWMALVDIVEDYFPGLDKEEYQKSLKECIEKQEAICSKVQGQIVGILLFSTEHSILAFLAVHPEFRKCGIAFNMIRTMTSAFPSGKDIWVTTYREGDPKGESVRALYLRCGFVPDELVVEMDYPCQKFVLHKK
jgi:ribosomal protein S18 acetylase RimI-like enzyme